MKPQTFCRFTTVFLLLLGARLSSSVAASTAETRRRHGQRGGDVRLVERRGKSPNSGGSVAVGMRSLEEAAKPRRIASLSTFRDAFVKGGVARCFGQAILYPVDALRTLAQTRDAKTLADVGAKALARGCLTTSSFALAMGALQFGVFASLRRAGCNPLLSSAAGASASCLVSVPQEVIKQRLVTGIYPSFRTAVTSIFNDEGLKGFYSAWRPTVLRNVPFVIITFTTMEHFKNQLIRRHNSEKCSTGTVDARREHKEKLSIGENVAIGMASALVAGIATNPVDVVKTRMMTQAASSAVPYKSALECVSAMLRNESPAAFYAGFPQRSVYMCGLWGITFAVNGWLHSRREDEQ